MKNNFISCFWKIKKNCKKHNENDYLNLVSIYRMAIELWWRWNKNNNCNNFIICGNHFGCKRRLKTQWGRSLIDVAIALTWALAYISVQLFSVKLVFCESAFEKETKEKKALGENEMKTRKNNLLKWIQQCSLIILFPCAIIII